MRRWSWMLACVLLVAAVQADELAVSAPDALIFGGVAMAPARPLAELLGGTIRREGASITLTRAGKTFTCTPGEPTAQANGKAISLPLAPFMRVGVTYVPLRAFITAWGGEVKLFKQSNITVIVPNKRMPVCLRMKYQRVDPAGYQDGDIELFVVNVDGTGLRRLTYDTDEMTLPVFSPDGSRFAMDLGGWLMQRRVDDSTPGWEASPDWFPEEVNACYIFRNITFLPNGHEILFSTDDTVEIADMNANRSPRVLAKGTNPCLSPDGTTIAYNDARTGREGLLMVMDRDGGNRREVGRGYCPQFSGDGRTLYFYEEYYAAPAFGPLLSCLLPARGAPATGETKVRQVIPDPAAREVVLSRDGRFLLYSKMGPAAGIYRFSQQDQSTRRLTTGEDYSPCVSPDGTHIAFMRDNGLWTMPLDGVTPVKLATAQTRFFLGDFTFTPDGRQLLFLDHPDLPYPEDDLGV